MASKVSAELIERQAEELQRLRHPAGRAAELAEEVEGINAAVFEEAAERMEFHDEPCAFQRVLLQTASGKEAAE